MNTATMPNQTTLASLEGLAIKGRTAEKRRDETFVSGTIKGDNMVLVFQSRSHRQIGPRKWAYFNHVRFVSCRRVFSPSHADYWWEGYRQHQTSYQA